MPTWSSMISYLHFIYNRNYAEQNNRINIMQDTEQRVTGMEMMKSIQDDENASMC